jgi:SAM-dependent methyltransferase
MTVTHDGGGLPPDPSPQRLADPLDRLAIDIPLGDGCVSCGIGYPFAEHLVSEGMHGTGETFTYRECGGCGSLQISAIPADLGSYYDPERYYSLNLNERLKNPVLKTWPVRLALRANTGIFLRSGLGRGKQWARQAGMRPSDHILEIGCGAGEILLRLHLVGFRHLAGADPFIDEDTEVAPGVPVWKRFHSEVEGRYDWVMLHHSFEHIPDPHATLRSCRNVLREGGKVLIRMPIMGQAAWRRYRTNWVQIDPPRHLIIYTPQGFEAIAKAQGFRVDESFYDSTAFQFWGSESVAAGRPFVQGTDGLCSREQYTAWTREASELNRRRDGDQGGYILSLA